MLTEYLKPGTRLLVIATERLSIRQHDSKENLELAVPQGTAMLVGYKAHLIADSIPTTELITKQLQLPEMSLVADLHLLVPTLKPATPFKHGVVVIPLAKTVVLESVDDRRPSFGWFVAPVESFNEVREALLGYPMATLNESPFTPKRQPVSSNFGHCFGPPRSDADWAVPSNNNPELGRSYGWNHDASLGPWPPWPKPEQIDFVDYKIPKPKPLYSIGTWNPETNGFTPHETADTPCVNVDTHGLRRHLKELRRVGYTCRRVRVATENGWQWNDDPWVLVQRTDGMPLAKILELWKR